MADFISIIKNSTLKVTVLDGIDILLISMIIYGLLKITTRTSASQVLKGLGLFIVLAQVCKLIGLSAMSWLLSTFIDAGVVLVVVIFQPEIRRALERMGRGKLFDIALNNYHSSDYGREIEELERAVLNMSKRKIGALIVFENKTGLKDVIESGNLINARISSELVENIFFPNSPLHDGAVIIRREKIIAAGCFLPLSDNRQISSELGTRHRAALGISELSDAQVLIVSEETGVISVAHEGTITRYLDRKALRAILEGIYITKPRSKIIGVSRDRKKGDKK